MRNSVYKFIPIVLSLSLSLGAFSCGIRPAPEITNTPTRLPEPTVIPSTVTPAPTPTPTITPLPTLESGMQCAHGLPRPYLTMDQFIVINSFNDVPDQVNAVAGILREYHNWNWDEAVVGNCTEQEQCWHYVKIKRP